MVANLNDIQRIYSEIPKEWDYEKDHFFNYDLLDSESHFSHGWREVYIPEFNPESQKLSNEYILVDGIVTKTVIDLTDEELQAIQNAKYLIPITEIKNKYEIHKSNGWDFYQDFRAKIVIDVQDSVITEIQAFIIESFLKTSFDRIAQTGDWKTAQYELIQVTGFPEFVNAYYDLSMAYISNYIIENYD